MSVLAITILAIGSALAGATGGYLVADRDVAASALQAAREERPATALYALCLDASRTGNAAGQNVRDCAPFIADSTTQGRLANFKTCVEIRATLAGRPEAQALDCHFEAFGRFVRKTEAKP